MNSSASHVLFREARQRLGLSLDDASALCGVSSASISDIEMFEGDLTRCYSLRDVQKFCRVLRIRPIELFGGDNPSEPAVTSEELVHRIYQECGSRGITLGQLEEAVGWRLSACIDPPTGVLEDMSVDGLQWLCRELRIDWHRVLLSL